MKQKHNCDQRHRKTLFMHAFSLIVLGKNRYEQNETRNKSASVKEEKNK